MLILQPSTQDTKGIIEVAEKHLHVTSDEGEKGKHKVCTKTSAVQNQLCVDGACKIGSHIRVGVSCTNCGFPPSIIPNGPHALCFVFNRENTQRDPFPLLLKSTKPWAPLHFFPTNQLPPLMCKRATEPPSPSWHSGQLSPGSGT